MKNLFVLLLSLLLFAACSNTIDSRTAQQPTLDDYEIGEKWVWKFKGVTNEGEVRSEGKDTRVVVENHGALAIVIGADTVPVAEIVQPEESKTPRYAWPLEVGKKWKYEKSWTSQDGTTGKQSQDVEVLSYQKETVKAGSFMAYTIQYKGTITNSRGYSAETDEVWLYAPKVKNFIKLTQTQGDFNYTEELVEYSIPE